jgi:hypothetical protein
MNKMQIIILLGGLILAGLCLILIFMPFNITYAYQHPVDTNTWTFVQVTCPAPIDSCDKGATVIGKAICDDCNNYATNRWIWFGVWEAIILVGMGVGIYSSRKA